MTPQGDIAIVETKLFRNPEARRRIVAQATWREVVDFPQPRSQEVRASFAAQSLRTIHLWLECALGAGQDQAAVLTVDGAC